MKHLLHSQHTFAELGEIAKRVANVLEVSIDSLVYGNRNLEDDIKDNELASLFKKAQQLSDKQKETVKDFLSAFVLKADGST